VRRLVVLFVVSLVGAAAFGLSSSSTGLSVNHEAVSANTFRAELAAISLHPTLDCFITALDPQNYAPGAGGDSIGAAGAAAWANFRVEGLAIDQYVTQRLKYVPDPAELAKATTSLELEMTQQAKNDSLNCPGTAQQALAEMPVEMRRTEIQTQATSLYLVTKLKKSIPLTTTSMQQFYASHVADYDTLCVSVAIVLPNEVSAFSKNQSAGMSVAELAKLYSQDQANASKGGAAGCFSPAESSYEAVRSDIDFSLPLNTFPSTPAYVTDNGSEYALYIAVTKKTVTPFASAEPAVLEDLQNLNAVSAKELKNGVLEAAAVHVDPAFGRWPTSSSGPEVAALTKPTKADVTGSKKLTTPDSRYR